MDTVKEYQNAKIVVENADSYTDRDVISARAYISGYDKAKSINDVPSDDLINLIPINWLDPLLSGKESILGEPPYNCPDIEKLLNALRDRLRDFKNPPLKETEKGEEWIDDKLKRPQFMGLYKVKYSDDSEGNEYYNLGAWNVIYHHPIAYWKPKPEAQTEGNKEKDYKSMFEEKCRQKMNLQKMYDDANQELIDNGLREAAITEGGAALAKNA